MQHCFYHLGALVRRFLDTFLQLINTVPKLRQYHNQLGSLYTHIV
jgi:hypothetical protein